MQQLINSVKVLLVLTFLTGVIYPFTMTLIAQVIFPYQANGSMMKVNGNIIGSELIGQNFSDESYFKGRPSMAGTGGYDASNSVASNLGPTSKKLMEMVGENINLLKLENRQQDTNIPSDLVLNSGSGLDPHISPESAYFQATRIAENRGISVDKVERLIDNNVEDRQFGLLGEPRINVVKLNVELDKLR